MTKQFKKGQRVVYIPSHVSDLTHPDIEHGVVSSSNEKFVFVKFDSSEEIMITGDEQFTAKAVNPNQLIVVSER